MVGWAWCDVSNMSDASKTPESTFCVLSHESLVKSGWRIVAVTLSIEGLVLTMKRFWTWHE
jgi:hypothetical protein